MTTIREGFTLNAVDWDPWLETVDAATASPEQLVALKENTRDGKVSPETMDAVTRREVAAGRMSPNDALRRIAAAGVVKAARRTNRVRRFGGQP